MSDFEKCVKTSHKYKIDCVLGLWSVEGSSKASVESKAFHYWQQYKKDGEYYKILGGESPAIVMLKTHNPYIKRLSVRQ